MVKPHCLNFNRVVTIVVLGVLAYLDFNVSVTLKSEICLN